MPRVQTRKSGKIYTDGFRFLIQISVLFQESISTCRFAQRVAMIKNDAILNEELDPKLMIAKLKREVAQLKEELSMATGQQRTEELSEEDMERYFEIYVLWIIYQRPCPWT